MPWEHVVLLPVGSLGMAIISFGLIFVLSLLMYLNHCKYHTSAKLSIGLNYCQVVPHQVNSNIGCHYQSCSKCINNLMSIWAKAGSTQVCHHMELIPFCSQKGWGPLYMLRLPGIKQTNEIGPLSITFNWWFTQQTHPCIVSERYKLDKWISLGLDSTRFYESKTVFF